MQAENLLERLRNFEVECSGEVLSLLLVVVDEVRKALGYIAQHGMEPELDNAALLQGLAKACSAESSMEVDGVQARDETETDPDDADEHSHADLSAENFIRLPVKKLDDFLDILAATSTDLGYWRTRLSGTGAHGMHSEVISGLEDVAQQMSLLQDSILQYRLEPIGRIWRPYQRLVRDLAVATEKRVLLVTTGEETEVDRSVLMTIKDPLGHLLRNAVVHGIETPQQRRDVGKAPVARLELSASQQYGQIILSVKDDGAGLDLDAIRATAVAKEIVSAARLEKMQDEDICQLIFMPGFSTSATVDNIAGRGTGLDVVRSVITAVGGSVQVHNQPGQGCCFEMHIPQSMALVSTLLVETGAFVIALPQSQVVEVVGLVSSQVQRYFKAHMGEPGFVFRGRCIPLYSLRDIATGALGSSGDALSRVPGSSGEINIVVLQFGRRCFAVSVDVVHEIADLVIKPLHRYLSHIPILSGGALLANGKVAFVLDVGGMLSWIDSVQN